VFPVKYEPGFYIPEDGILRLIWKFMVRVDVGTAVNKWQILPHEECTTCLCLSERGISWTGIW
jgi:hypothetical protein